MTLSSAKIAAGRNFDLRDTDRPGTGEGRRCPVVGCRTHGGRFPPSSRISWLAPSAIGQITDEHAVIPREDRGSSPPLHPHQNNVPTHERENGDGPAKL